MNNRVELEQQQQQQQQQPNKVERDLFGALLSHSFRVNYKINKNKKQFWNDKMIS